MARTLLAGLLAAYGTWLVFDYQWHFVDGANLLFHEAGHVFFGVFGTTIGILGGTLGQLFFPVACLAHFLRRASLAEASAAVVWLGENLMNIALYVADARAQVLPRVGGDIHDWSWLLGRSGLLAHDAAIAGAIHGLGVLVVIAGVAAGAAAAAPRRRPASQTATGAGL